MAATNDALGPFFALGRADTEDHLTPRPLLDDWEADTVRHTWSRMILERFVPGEGEDTAPVLREAAASTVHLGLCARLVSPWFGRAVLEARYDVPAPQSLRWVPDGTTSFPLIPGEYTSYSDPLEWANAFVPVLQTLVIDSGFVRSPAITWGNLTSSINGAVNVVAAAAPTRADIAVLLGQLLVDAATRAANRKRGLHRGNVGDGDFSRLSCCLYYRLLPQGTPKERATCGDCVLRSLG